MKILFQVNVYLSKSLADNLYLLQYPVRTASLSYDEVEHVSTKVKPQQKKVEMHLSMNTRSSNYSRSKGEQIALNVDGGVENPSECVYASDKMDKQVLRSTACSTSAKRYAVGLLKDNEVHITPLSSINQMKPVFDYLDRADVKAKNRLSSLQTDESSQDETEEEVKPVTVKFARPENDITKARRLASYKYQLSQLETERWIPVLYHHKDDDQSAANRLSLIASKNDDISEFHLHSKDYLNSLIPPEKSEEKERPEMPTNVLSLSQLRTLPLADQIKSLLINVKVMRFSQLLSLLDPGTDPTSVLRPLQVFALLVQGCWVVKSEILYPKEACSPVSGISSEYLCRGRDYIMWKFTHSRYVIRKDISSVIKLPAEDVKEQLEQMSTVKAIKGWEFLYEYDYEFCDKYNDILQRQKMLWDARYQTLSKAFKIPKELEKKSKATDGHSPVCNSPDKSKRRKSSPRTRTPSAMSTSDVSDMETDTHHSRQNSESDHNIDSVQEPMDTSEIKHVTSNGPMKKVKTNCDNGLIDDKKLTLEIISFLRDLLNKKKIFSLSELKGCFENKILQCPSGHVFLSSNINDQLLIDNIVTSGGKQLNNQWPPKTKADVLFAQITAGDMFDKMRMLLLELFENSFRVKIGAVRNHFQEELQDEVSEVTCKKLLKEYCISRGGFWYLKETLPTDS
ncbi:hypothetical protein LOTGIDRAFT_108154 [Lottia gigantea]|uniref:DNA-directed RNA polymerase III subunit RPC5 C-terminal domain-containing protein n=1 Tax=Lottia gigantea TaxID=225164 RepID=V3ZT47_LOTGI|nr:hypothetical protein LOTGIDRAFT_108154 [Lottia gigantea]ESO84071.1 hypothetical protein LOTGIDRAFT_108154 [Lottia gigantea]